MGVAIFFIRLCALNSFIVVLLDVAFCGLEARLLEDADEANAAHSQRLERDVVDSFYFNAANGTRLRAAKQFFSQSRNHARMFLLAVTGAGHT